jgi:hypothetical protein
MMRSPLCDIGRLQQQGFKYKNLTHAHDRLLEWETWFKSESKTPPPASPAPNEDAAAIDTLVRYNSSKITDTITRWQEDGLKPNIEEASHIAQTYMISPVITARLLRMADDLAAAGGASASGMSPGLSSPSSNRAPTVSAYQAFLDKFAASKATDPNQSPKIVIGTALPTPQPKATQPAPKAKPAPRSGPDR